MRKHATHEVLMEFARKAHADLSNFPEFGKETQIAIVDTAGDALYDAGYDFNRLELFKVAESLA